MAPERKKNRKKERAAVWGVGISWRRRRGGVAQERKKERKKEKKKERVGVWWWWWRLLPQWFSIRKLNVRVNKSENTG